MTERQWAMIRIDAGDYLLPSNDGKTLWRLRRYLDGRSHGLLDMKGDRHFWSCSHYDWAGKTWPTDNGAYASDPLELLEVDRWTEVECWLPTRKKAIEVALSTEPGNTGYRS